MDRGLDPRTWQRRHLITWAALIVLGAAVGLVFGWFVSPFSRIPQGDAQTLIITWLHYPEAYWPYMTVGAVTFGFAYYAADLLTGAR